MTGVQTCALPIFPLENVDTDQIIPARFLKAIDKEGMGDNLLNKLYQTRLLLCPLNLSNRILANKYTYVKCIDHIYFGLSEDTNKEINNWLDFILTMADEQLYYSKSRLEDLVVKRVNNEPPDEYTLKKIKQMKISRLK